MNIFNNNKRMLSFKIKVECWVRQDSKMICCKYKIIVVNGSG